MNLRNTGTLAKRQTIAMIAVAAFNLKKARKKEFMKVGLTLISLYDGRSGYVFFCLLHDRTIKIVLQLYNLPKGYL